MFDILKINNMCLLHVVILNTPTQIAFCSLAHLKSYINQGAKIKNKCKKQMKDKTSPY